MLKIGDFSKFGRVSVKTLRYYDEIGLLKPVRVDQFTGYRYYSVDQLSHLNRIIGLRDLGLSLDEIGQLLANSLSSEKLIELMRAKREEVLVRLYEEETRLRRVEEWLKNVEKEGIMPEQNVIIKKAEPIMVAAVRGIIPRYNDVSPLFQELFVCLGKKRIQVIGPSMAIYHDAEYREKDVDVEVMAPVKGNPVAGPNIKIRELAPVEQMACIVHKGPYETISLAYTALMKWVEANGYRIDGSQREVYLTGPGQFLKGNPDSYITEIQLPVTKSD